MKPSISAILIVKNEALHVRRCLASLTWVDELIVLDSGSTDDTVAICREFTEQVYVTDWPGYGPQKNRALAKARGDWIFSIDADEWVTPELQAEILQLLTQPATQAFDAFYIPRRTQYLDRWVDYGDVGRDRVIRLFRRDKAKFTDVVVHETIEVPSNRIGQLKNYLCHHSYRTVEELLGRMNHYTTLSAQINHQKGKKSSVPKAFAHALWAFFKAYFLRLGFMDGSIGFVVAVSSAESSYYRHLKLWRQGSGFQAAHRLNQ